MDQSELENILSQILEMEPEKLKQLISALDRVRDNKFGDVIIEMRKQRITRINYIILGKPDTF